MTGLLVKTASNVTRVYEDDKTGADKDVAVFQADLGSLAHNHYIIGQVALPIHTSLVPASSIVVVSPLTEDAIRPPIGYNQMWNDKKSGGKQDISFWQVVPPDGYVALGDVVNAGYAKPPDTFTAKYACIKRELLAPGILNDTPIWTDRGSGASLNGSLWQVENEVSSPCGLAGFFKAASGYSKPVAQVYVLPAKVKE